MDGIPCQSASGVSKGTDARRGAALRFWMQSPNASDDDLQMHGLVYLGPGRRSWEAQPRPALREPTDAIVRLTTSTICGTDLHILKGDVPSVTEGRILGHEGVGVVTEVGTGVTTFHVGDRVLISCITSCGRCDFCRKQMYSHCRQWRLDPREHHRRHPSRLRAHSVCRHQPVCHSRGR